MSRILLILVVVVVFGGVAFLFFQKNNTANAPTGDSTPVIENTSEQGENNNVMPQTHVITFMDSGYSPAELKVKLGDTVTWRNESEKQTWPASAMHPTHMVYGGTSLSEHCNNSQATPFDACAGVEPEGSWSFTFDKAGTWWYHDHLNVSHFGSVVVE